MSLPVHNHGHPSASTTTTSEAATAPTKGKVPFGSTARPNNRAPFAKHVVAVTSGKGGVGKTTVAVNLAVALAQRGLSVGLLDADVYGPSVPRMLGVDHERMQWNDANQMVPAENYGVQIVSVGLTTPDADTPLGWRSAVATSALIQLLEDVAWRALDVLVIDMPPGTGDVQLTMAQELPLAGVVFVTTPQSVATDDVRRAIRMYQEVAIPLAGVVENMSFFKAPDTGTVYRPFGEGGGRMLARDYGIPFLGELPLDEGIRTGSDGGEPPVARGSDETRAAFAPIVDGLLATIEQKRARPSNA